MKMAAESIPSTTEIQVDDREIARLNAIHAHRSKEKQIEMGWIGRIFGSVGQIPGNVAALAVTASFALFAIVLVWVPDTPSLSKKDALTIVGGFISLALGFLFGRTTSQ